MNFIDIPLEQLREATWNPNQMDEAMLERLRESLRRFDMVSNLVVRPLGEEGFEVISGTQRLEVLRELGWETAPCVVVDLDDAQARLLAQALNRVQGEDDLGLRADLLREVLKSLPQEEVLSLLPETAASLQALASLGHQDMARHLQNWQQAQSARLRHLTFQSTPAQVEVIEAALNQLMPLAKGVETGNPNPRGNARFLLCKSYLEQQRRIS
jgi:ParB family transcriptional regulator, chromosome partitioning protein